MEKCFGENVQNNKIKEVLKMKIFQIAGYLYRPEPNWTID